MYYTTESLNSLVFGAFNGAVLKINIAFHFVVSPVNWTLIKLLFYDQSGGICKCCALKPPREGDRTIGC